MGADDDINVILSQTVDDILLLLGAAETAQKLNLDAVRSKTLGKGIVMLLG